MSALLSELLPRNWVRRERETPLAAYVSLSSMVTAYDAITRDGTYVRVFRLAGIPFECVDAALIRLRHEAKAHWLAGLPGGRFRVREFRIQRFVTARLSPIVGGYAGVFDTDLTQVNTEKPFLINELFLILEYIPPGAMGSRTAADIAIAQAEAIQLMEEQTEVLRRSLPDLQPELLGEYERDGVTFSEVKEFFGYLINGDWRPVRAGAGPMFRSLPVKRLSAKGSLVELRDANRCRYAAVVDVKEYQDLIQPGCLDSLLYQRVEYIECFCFAPMRRKAAQDALSLQQRQLLASDDVVQSQIDAMTQAMDEVGAGHGSLGEFHYSLIVFGNTPAEASRNAAGVMGAVAELSGIQLAKVDVATEAAWFAMLPGNHRWRTRHARITSRAYAALAANHGFSLGKPRGNPWGEALILLRTPSGQPFYLSLHVSSDDQDDEGRKLPANTVIFGVTGAGKTTLKLALLAQSRRYNPAPRLFLMDLDRDCEIFVRAMGGHYFRLRIDVTTGINPFQMEPTPDRIAFWVLLVEAMVDDPALPFLPIERTHIVEAVRTMARMPVELRRPSTIRENLPLEGPHGPGTSVYDRMGRWCESGALAWVFDLAPNRLPDPTEADIIGVDYTEFLDHPDVRTPLVMTLLRYVEDMTDGRRLIFSVSEFWKALDDPRFEEFIRKTQKTIRKKNGLGIYDTQEPYDALCSRYGPTLISQAVTKLFCADEEARSEGYCDGVGLTRAELHIVRTLRKDGHHRFLFKQQSKTDGHQSAICELDLSALPQHIVVLSGGKDNVELLDEIRGQVGDDPDDWMPVLLDRVRERDERAKHRRST